MSTGDESYRRRCPAFHRLQIKSMRLLVARLGLIGLLAASSGAAKQPITATDLVKLRSLTGVDTGRDGSLAVYTVQSVHFDFRTEPPAKGGYRSHLWLIDLRDANAKPVQLTFDEREDTSPAISPDGKQLAFVRVEESDKKHVPQVWLISLDGPGEAHPLTALEYGAVEPRWRSDGTALLVSSAIPISKLPGKPPFPEERPNRDWWDFDRPATGKTPDISPDGNWSSIRNWLELNASRRDPEDIIRLDFLGEQGLAGERTFTQFFRVDLPETGPKTTQLTSSFLEHTSGEWSPSGSQIVFSARPSVQDLPEKISQRSSIWITEADGSKERALLNDDRYSFSAPQFTNDGKHIFALSVQSDEPTYRQAALVICDSDGARPEWLTSETSLAVQQPRSLGDKIYFTVNTQGSQELRVVDIKSKQVKTLVDGPIGVNVFAVAPGRVVYGLVTVPDPSELYLSTGSKQQTIGAHPERSRAPRKRQLLPLAPLFERASITRRLTDLNATWLEEKEISLPEEHWLRRPDETRIQYWLMRPTQFQPGKKYPWVVNMHGGPAAMWGPGEATMWHEFQTLCSFGFGVLYVNPRGSSGYGYPFQRANYKDWGDGPMSEVIAAIDDSTMRDPSIDHRRLFLTGGSYGGYLTAWIIAHDHRFKAAVAQRGVYDLATFFGEGNAYRLIPNEFGGYPWEPDTRRLLEMESPLTYARQIDTPLLILHGSEDNRAGVAQSQMLYRALKQMGKPVEYVRYPGAGHELTRSGTPHQRIDHLLRMIEFFERYADNDRPAPIDTQAQAQ
jgi:dipeptidyl aminopeptidase/acylaminoacyl peptidase